MKLPDWLSNINPLSGGMIVFVYPATRYTKRGAVGIGCANTQGVYSSHEP
ncbi:MAG: hypothetical protein ABSA12_03215 [Verrucomicrobiia bacterium]